MSESDSDHLSNLAVADILRKFFREEPKKIVEIVKGTMRSFFFVRKTLVLWALFKYFNYTQVMCSGLYVMTNQAGRPHLNAACISNP